MMKKKVLLLVGAAMMLFQACQNNDNIITMEKDDTKTSAEEIQFANYVDGMTRASKGKGASFVEGDEISVFGFQLADGDTALLFNKQRVTSVGQNVWSYYPVKYWEKNSIYDFYALYPYTVNHSFDSDSRHFSITDFTVQNDANKQQDVMIAKQITGHQPYNQVNFEFSHILSNVNFLFKVADNFDKRGIENIVITSFDVTGLYGTGSFTQSGWSNGIFEGGWTPNVESEYDMPVVENAIYDMVTPAELAGDLLLLPQTIDDSAKIRISFRLVYEDNSECVYKRTVALNKIVGSKRTEPDQKGAVAKWDPNYRYFYVILADPSLNEFGGSHQPNANASHSQDELNNQDDNPIKPDVNLMKFDDTDGDGIEEYYIDVDLDDVPDYPVIWKDIDGDGWLEGLPDSDGDGEPDLTDDGDYKVIWLDTNNDKKVDTELQIKIPTPDDDIPTNPGDEEYPDTAYVDYDGGAGGGYQTPTAWIIADSITGEYYIDTDNDGEPDVHILWKDIDDDDMLEGVADKNGDGVLDEKDTYDNDGVDYMGNPNIFDVTLYYKDGNWKELEKEPATEPEIPETKNVIEFSATVSDWNDNYDASSTVVK